MPLSSSFAEVLGLSSSKLVWDSLESIFQQQCQAKLDLLLDELQSLTKGTFSIEDYLLKIKTLADNLAAINHPVSESELVTPTLNGLPSTMEYQPVVKINKIHQKHFKYRETLILRTEHLLLTSFYLFKEKNNKL